MLTLLEQILSDYFGWIAFAIMAGFVLRRIAKRESQVKQAKKILEKAIATKADEPMTLHPEINPDLCAGCGTCTKVCPEGGILQLIDHKAVLVSPTKCVGHGECAQACPMNAIELVFGTKRRGMDIPSLTSNYETNVPGLYISGELGGMGLIRNAVKQGHLAAAHALKKQHKPQSGVVDLLVVGAGPAGLAASLTAISSKRSYRCIEQGSFGGTVANFPRQKVVMTHPAELPVVGKMKFPSNKVSKEELLAYWNEVRKKTNLKVEENTRFETLEKVGEVFRVKTNKGEILAHSVILAMGVRGSPRKLGLPNEDTNKVTYNLIDPSQYQKKKVVVVGGGNAGVEAAQYLAKESLKNEVKLLVRGPDFDRCNEENQKIILGLSEKGLVEICFNSSVKEIHADSLLIEQNGKPRTLANDFLFVFAGAESPHKFLMSLGIKIEKKFGEKLGKSA